MRSRLKQLTKVEGQTEIKHIDIQSALEKYQLAQAGITVTLDDLNIVEADIIQFLKTEMDKKQQRELEKQKSKTRGI